MHLVVPHYLYAERLSWNIAYWVGFVAMVFVSSLAHTREKNGAPGDNRDRGSKRVIYILSMVAFIFAFTAPALVPQADIQLPHEDVFIIAMTMLWAGVLLYGWAVMTLGAFFRTSVQLLDGQKLVTRGPYRLLRHPAYTGGILIFTGIGLGVGNWVSVAGSAFWVIVAYAWRIHVEEEALSERFGAEFAAHRKRTWAVIPLLW